MTKKQALLTLWVVFIISNIVVSQNIVIPGQIAGTITPLTITYDGASGIQGSWIGFFPVSGNDGSFITYQYIDENIEGTLSFAGIWESGYYNFRMFSGGGYNKICTSEPFLIRQGAIPDETFGSGGIFKTDMSLNLLDDWAADVKTDDNGRCIVVGAANNGQLSLVETPLVDIVVLRFTSNGDPDSSFGNNGIVRTTFQDIQPEFVTCMVVQPDGKIIAGGSAITGTSTCLVTTSIFLIRYNENGTIDTEFGNNGIVLTNFTWPEEPPGYSNDQLSALQLQPDGKILAGGTGHLCESGWGVPARCNMSRYLENGLLDPGFGSGGRITFYSSAQNYPESYTEQLKDLTITPAGGDGSIFVAVTSGDGGVVANNNFIYKFTSSGNPDLTFGNQGVVVDPRPGFNNGQQISSIILGEDNNLYIMGCTSSQGWIWLMKKDPGSGAPANNFGDEGLILYNNEAAASPGNMEFINNRLFVSHATNNNIWSVTAFNTDGSADVSFGTTHFKTMENDMELPIDVNAMAVQQNGNIYLAGMTFSFTDLTWDFSLVKLVANPEVFELQSHTITLNEGWNGISSYVAPAYNAVHDLLSGITDDVIALQDLTLVYLPGGGDNTLMNWDYSSGYQIKMGAPLQLTVTGPYPTSKSVMLWEGWNLMPVLSATETDIITLFGENLAFVEIVKDAADTGVFWPAMNVNRLTSLKPGKSYLVKATQFMTITFE